MASVSNAFSLNLLGNGNHIHLISFYYCDVETRYYLFCKIRCKTVFTSVTLNFTVIRTLIFNDFHADQVPHLEVQIKYGIQEGHN